MRSIRVPLELTVRLVSEGEGAENTTTALWLLTFGFCATAFLCLDFHRCCMQTPCAVACQWTLFAEILPRNGDVAMNDLPDGCQRTGRAPLTAFDA